MLAQEEPSCEVGWMENKSCPAKPCLFPCKIDELDELVRVVVLSLKVNVTQDIKKVNYIHISRAWKANTPMCIVAQQPMLPGPQCQTHRAPSRRLF